MKLLSQLLDLILLASMPWFGEVGRDQRGTEFEISQVEKHELQAVHLVRFHTYEPSEQFGINLFQPHLWQPAHLRPLPGQPFYPVPELVLIDRARRYATWQANVLDDAMRRGDKLLKATVDGQIVGMAAWEGPKSWKGADAPPGSGNFTEELLEIMNMGFGEAFEESHQKLMGELFPDAGSVSYLTNLYVLPEYQGLGIGTALLDSLLHNATHPCFLESSDVAEAFYEWLGFRKVGKVSAWGWKDGIVRKGGEKDEIAFTAMVWEP